MYSFIVSIRNCLYDKNKIGLTRCNVPVISIGNLSVGGTGKTPFVMYLCKELLEAGYKPAVIGRGYKRKGKGMVIVSDGSNIKANVKDSGDEMYLIARDFNIPIITNSKKSEAAKFVDNNFDIDFILVDDGFQHRKLHRDCDIVLISKQTLLHPYLLPIGRLREPLNSLKRADIICLTKGANLDLLKKNLSYKLYNELKEKSIIECKFSFKGVYNLFSSEDIYINKDLPIFAIAGIAQPKSFFDMLILENYNIIDYRAYSDHQNYSIRDINYIISIVKSRNIKYIAVTEKDAVKLKLFENEFIKNGMDIIVFKLDLVFEEIL